MNIVGRRMILPQLEIPKRFEHFGPIHRPPLLVTPRHEHYEAMKAYGHKALGDFQVMTQLRGMPENAQHFATGAMIRDVCDAVLRS